MAHGNVESVEPTVKPPDAPAERTDIPASVDGLPELTPKFGDRTRNHEGVKLETVWKLTRGALRNERALIGLEAEPRLVPRRIPPGMDPARPWLAEKAGEGRTKGQLNGPFPLPRIWEEGRGDRISLYHEGLPKDDRGHWHGVLLHGLRAE